MNEESPIRLGSSSRLGSASEDLLDALGPDQAAFAAAGEPRIQPLDVPAFLRLFQLRGAQIMWFLGAGASRAAGIKTAGDMIWDFKQRLYRSQKKLPPSAITDIGEPSVQRKIQAHFDEKGEFPAAGSETEYSAYFEATYHAARDRRTYLDELIARGKPSFGHHALALLMAEDLCRIVWTTNFDRTVEDAAAERFGGTGRLVTADLKEPEKIRRAVDENRWPVYGKLHGDYHSDTLKNSDAELRQQDAEMRRNLVDACRRSGLAVVGYSGRDASIMAALTEAIDEGRGFPGGLFWFKRSQDAPYPVVTALIAHARALGIDAHLVEAESFDELFSDLLRFLPQTADKLAGLAGDIRPRLTNVKPRSVSAAVPAIRMNALAVTSRPALCRIVDCQIGGDKEIEEAIAKAGVDIIAHRSRDGVLAFGRDSDVRMTFEPFGIKAFDQHPLSAKRLVKECGERALIRDALFRAIAKRPGLAQERQRNRVRLVPLPGAVSAGVFNTDKARPVDRISGIVPQTSVRWSEACGLRIDYRLDQLWLLIEPTLSVALDEDASDEAIELTREFVRERRARRHNRLANALLDGWISLIVGPERSLRLRTFDIADGIDAGFEILRTSAFSGIVKP
ncbi:SIR2 family NAD-dependent protein deacylase [Rhodoplanes sp. SY1]|uniref:SIR2 family NAD-dependent protein deacylase n=1 Tax=Rhodoplanes sp. SY1 TaxID=3166646 RepID=UPI0038B56FEF